MIEQITVTELKALMDSGNPRVVDVREQWEYDSGHVPGAEWIPMALVPLHKAQLQQSEPVYFVCRTGNRSGQVVMWLQQQGIRGINVHGGTQLWQQHGFPVETATERVTQS